MLLYLNKKEINSIGLAIFICANPLSWVFPIPNIIILIAIFAVLILVINNGIRFFLGNKKVYLFIFFILFFFITQLGLGSSAYNNEKFYIYFGSFLVFGISGFLISQLSFCYQTFYKTIILFSALLLPVVLKLDFGDSSEHLGDVDTGMWMGVSYGTLRLIISAIIVLKLYKSKINTFLALVVLLGYLYIYVSYASRGAILAVFTFICLFYFLRKDKIKLRNFLLLFSLGFLFILNIDSLAMFLQEFLSNYNINVNAIDKIVIFSNSTGDLSNGRTDIYNKAFEEIVYNPIFGNGIAVFDFKYGLYPHNFVVQILYEGGIVYLLPVLIIFMLSFYYFFSDIIQREDKVFLLFLFCSGIFELLFSFVYWRSVFFWFYVGYIINLYNTYSLKKNKR